MTYQTSEPVKRLPVNISARAWVGLVDQLRSGDMTYDTPYQRGDVWTTGQRVLLIYSILSGTPIPALIIAERPASAWYGPDGSRMPIYAVIDGKQRLTTVEMFRDNRLAVPASWFAAERIEKTEDTGDGPYVRWEGLTATARRFFGNRPAATAEGPVETIAEEAAIYLRVNGGGTPQSAEDMARAADLAAVAENLT